MGRGWGWGEVEVEGIKGGKGVDTCSGERGAGEREGRRRARFCGLGCRL